MANQIVEVEFDGSLRGLRTATLAARTVLCGASADGDNGDGQPFAVTVSGPSDVHVLGSIEMSLQLGDEFPLLRTGRTYVDVQYTGDLGGQNSGQIFPDNLDTVEVRFADESDDHPVEISSTGKVSPFEADESDDGGEDTDDE